MAAGLWPSRHGDVSDPRAIQFFEPPEDPSGLSIDVSMCPKEWTDVDRKVGCGSGSF